ncbi:MAG: helix-turn-helix domain-containing protein [Myxococcota bacterium]|nr:helix-turn-helix domain-containing protein [Myxococcota bacterium]
MTTDARKLTRREALGVESRRRILDATSALMAERGFAGTSISAISKRSGLPSGSIYWHFESKERLLGAVVEEGVERWLESLPGPESLPADPTGAVEAVLDAAAGSLEEHPQFLRLLIVIALERREIDPASLASIRRTRLLARQRIEELMRVLLGPVLGDRAGDLAAEFAAFTLYVADGAFIAHHIDPDTTDLRAAFHLMRRSLTALARESAAEKDSANDR